MVLYGVVCCCVSLLVQLIVSLVASLFADSLVSEFVSLFDVSCVSLFVVFASASFVASLFVSFGFWFVSLAGSSIASLVTYFGVVLFVPLLAFLCVVRLSLCVPLCLFMC